MKRTASFFSSCFGVRLPYRADYDNKKCPGTLFFFLILSFPGSITQLNWNVFSFWSEKKNYTYPYTFVPFYTQRCCCTRTSFFFPLYFRLFFWNNDDDDEIRGRRGRRSRACAPRRPEHLLPGIAAAVRGKRIGDPTRGPHHMVAALRRVCAATTDVRYRRRVWSPKTAFATVVVRDFSSAISRAVPDVRFS